MKTYERGEVYSHSFFTLARDGGGWGSAASTCHTYFREGELVRRLGGPQSRAGRFGFDEEKSLYSCH